MSNYDAFANEWNLSRKNMWGEFDFAKDFLSAKSILDGGCGNGRLLRWLEENKFEGEYLGVDSSQELIKLAKQNFPKQKFIHQDLREFQSLPQFDAIFSIAVLHHLRSEEERLRVLQNLHQSLRKDGKIFLTTWNLFQTKYLHHLLKNFSRDVEIPFANQGKRFIHAFTKNEMRRLLEQAGFREVKIFYAKHNSRSNFLQARNLIAIAKK